MYKNGEKNRALLETSEWMMLHGSACRCMAQRAPGWKIPYNSRIQSNHDDAAAVSIFYFVYNVRIKIDVEFWIGKEHEKSHFFSTIFFFFGRNDDAFFNFHADREMNAYTYMHTVQSFPLRWYFQSWNKRARQKK